jgi:hypothetical protein
MLRPFLYFEQNARIGFDSKTPPPTRDFARAHPSYSVAFNHKAPNAQTCPVSHRAARELPAPMSLVRLLKARRNLAKGRAVLTAFMQAPPKASTPPI